MDRQSGARFNLDLHNYSSKLIAVGKIKQLPIILFIFMLVAYPVFHAFQHHHHELEDHSSHTLHDILPDHHESNEVNLVDSHHHDLHPHLEFTATINSQFRDEIEKIENYNAYIYLETYISYLNTFNPIILTNIQLRPHDPFQYRNQPLLI